MNKSKIPDKYIYVKNERLCFRGDVESYDEYYNIINDLEERFIDFVESETIEEFELTGRILDWDRYDQEGNAEVLTSHYHCVKVYCDDPDMEIRPLSKVSIQAKYNGLGEAIGEPFRIISLYEL